MMERSEKELRPYAETFLEILEHWCDIDLYSVNHYHGLDIGDANYFHTEEDLKEYTAGLKRLLNWERIEVMKDRLGALTFGEEVFTKGYVDTEDGVYLASVMREARIRLEAELKRLTST
jgi:hypothetical protein